MSFKNNIFDQLKIKLTTKNIVILKGNTKDIILNENLGIKFEKNDGVRCASFVNYLTYLLHDLDYKQIYYYSPFLGNKKVINGEIATELDDEASEPSVSDFSVEDAQTDEPNFEDFIKRCKNNIRDNLQTRLNKLKEESQAYIIDFSEFIFDSKSRLNSDEIAMIIEMFTIFLNDSTRHYLLRKNKLIIVMNNQEIFNSINFLNNPEVVSLNIQKPNFQERYNFLEHLGLTVTLPNKSIDLKDQEVLNQAATLTDGNSFREILQIIKLLYLDEYKDVDFKNFKSLYRLSHFDKKDSEWEKLDYSKIKNLDSLFKERVVGQDDAINAIKTSLVRSLVGLQGAANSSENQSKPRGVLFFAGPTGVGKTEMAKALNEFVFGDEKNIVRFDMSEYNHEESDQKLIGAPPGYVGYEAGGQLTNAILKKPFSILLFDEIEKAHNKIFDKFLQILEDGRLTSSKGETVDFSETFIIFTSNIGAKDFKTEFSLEETKKHFKKAVINYFVNELKRPEILNRIGIKNIIPFLPLDESSEQNIINIKLNNVLNTIENKWNLTVSIDDKTRDDIKSRVIKIRDKMLGGRDLITKLETVFVDDVSNYLFDNYEKLFPRREEKRILKIARKAEDNDSDSIYQYEIK
ncbi:AAA family ATPase [Mycoplasma bradburyae]|uniref:AAA family ATPase n=1 Tax=Mycoplasma bradburyae TaxID=2963128 RepID=UPI0023424AA9|nr:AAA family ATPase [Mycoplasma bradburyae]MDC4184279.1 AAA family ATPase [Mycoplasma bradburyae]